MEKGQGKRMDTLQTDKVFTRKEYIEREAAIVAIKSLYPGIPLAKIRLQKWHEKNKNFMECEMALERIPAADVVPVRHGRWIKVDDGIYYHMECSLCHERPLRNRWANDNEFSLYCPNCGARMDGDGDV